MKSRIADYRIFLKEFRRTYHTTGAILPSGRSLAKALSRHVQAGEGNRRILEVGPGTGAVTEQIIRCMKPGDQLTLVELNRDFVDHLKQRLASDPTFKPMADRVKIMHCRIEDLDGEQPYDLAISGLPLNNFSVELVEQILNGLLGLLQPGGTLSFFEYIAIRKARSIISGAADRERLRGISRVLGNLFRDYECQRQWIWPNVPPAWVHHIQSPSGADKK